MKSGSKNPRKSNITTTFYRNFFLLIVIPLLLVLLISLGYIRHITLEKGEENLQLSQQGMQNMLETELKDNTIKLANFALSNEAEVLLLASGILDDLPTRPTLLISLQSYVNLLKNPYTDMISLHFYGETGIVSFQNDLQVPLETLKAMSWYQRALAEENRIVAGITPASITRRHLTTNRNQHVVIVLAVAPSKSFRNQNVEMLCYYMNSKTALFINQKNQTEPSERTYLLDQDNNVLMGMNGQEDTPDLPAQVLAVQKGLTQYKNGNDTTQYFVSPVESTTWRLVSSVSNREILAGFDKIYFVIFLVSISLFSLFMLFSFLFFRGIIQPVNNLVEGMSLVESGNLSTRVDVTGKAELANLTQSFNTMLDQMQALLQSNESKERERHRAEMEALQSQINPHFLVNTLATMRFVAMSSKVESLQTMAEALISILTNSFKQSTSLYTLAEELELLESYAYLMKVRYSEGFDVSYFVEESAKDCLVPRLILQPLVENAIIHAFEDMATLGEIRIAAHRQGDTLFITVGDNGRGISNGKIQQLLKKKGASNGIGLYNVNQRITLNFGTEYGLSIVSTLGAGTTVSITMPAWEEEMK